MILVLVWQYIIIILLIGAPGSDNGNGVVYLYRKDYAGEWIVVKTFENPNATTDPSQVSKVWIQRCFK